MDCAVDSPRHTFPPPQKSAGARHARRMARRPWRRNSNLQGLIHHDKAWAAHAAFPDSAKSAHLPRKTIGGFGVKEMSRLSLMLLMATGLVLTTYFGVAAWQVSGDSRVDITGTFQRGTR